MKPDELDRILSKDEITPSSGFTAAVMEAVRREAEAPPPIAFPWKRALPGLIVTGVAVTLVLFSATAHLSRGPKVLSPIPPSMAGLGPSVQSIMQTGGYWALGALLLSYMCIKLAMSFSTRRA